MKSLFKKFGSWIKNHRKSSLVILILVIIGGYQLINLFSNSDLETRYVLANVKRGDVVSTISGSGQISAFDQFTLSAKASGDLTLLNVKAGQEVQAGSIIAQVDSGDAYFDFEIAQLSYDKLVTIDPDDLRSAENAVVDSKRDLEDSYINARTLFSKISTDLSDVIQSLEDLYNCNTGYLSECKGYSKNTLEKQYKERASTGWDTANKKLEDFVNKYHTISRISTNEEIEEIVAYAYDAAISVAEAANYAQDAVVYLRDNSDNSSNETLADSSYATVVNLVSSANTVVSDVAATRSSIISNKRTLETSQVTLDKLKEGPDALDLRSSELSLRQKRESLADHLVKAPFAGIIASVVAKKGDTVNSGTTIATLITKKKIAEISLNEIDVAKIKVNQKATLTFDALEDLTIKGEVVEVDSIGTVSQGVVNYKVKIAFDVDDARVKSGMTVSASIVTDMKENVIMVPISAVKAKGRNNYIEVIEGNTSPVNNNQTAGVVLSNSPTQVLVEIGLSGDEYVEIVSGVNEGEQYVIRTIAPTATTKTTTASAPSLFGGGASRTGTVRTVGGTSVQR